LACWYAPGKYKNSRFYVLLSFYNTKIAKNLTANKLSKNNYPNKLHTFKEYVTIIDFVSHPGSNVPYMPYLYPVKQ
jgi:hypothetical protein